MAKTQPGKIKARKAGTGVMWFDHFKNVSLICLSCLFVYSLYFFNTKKFDDSSFLGGDEWEYQSMAVNYATGHGFPVFGCAEPFKKYKLTTSWSKESFDYYSEEFQKEKPHYYFYRTPGYPFYLGVIYKVFGISPKIAKRSQLFMLIVVASFLPLLGFIYWKRAGLIGGIIGGILFLNKYSSTTEELMTESLIMLALFMLLFSFILYEKKRNLYTASLFGLLMGIGLLIKGSLIYIPVLFFAYLLYQLFRKKNKIIYVVVPIAVCAITVLPWSLFATKKEGKPVVLSTQGDVILLEGNNEATFTDGSWNPEALKLNSPTTFYNKPEIKDLPATKKLFLFYKLHYDKIPVVIKNKLVAGLEEFIYLKISLILILSEMLFLIIHIFIRKNWIRNKNEPVWRITSLIFAALAGVIFFKIIFLLIATLVLTLILLPTGTISATKMPVSFAILFLNFLLIVIVILGLPRYTYVIDYLFMLTTCTYVLLNLENLFLPKQNNLILQQKKNV